MPENNEPAVTVKNTASLLEFCAHSMHYPDKEWLTSEYFALLCTILKALEAEGEQKQIEQISANSNIIEDLQVEHTRLFINNTPAVIAPPYGSVYRDKSLAGKYSEEISLFYKKWGYTITPQKDIPESVFPDSILHQLYFLSVTARSGRGDIIDTFLTRFFTPWFGEFAAKVKEGAEMPFYPIIISIIEYLTKEEDYAL